MSIRMLMTDIAAAPGRPGVPRIGAPHEALLAVCYGEIRTIAQRVLRSDGAQLQIQPTDLAHEAALRMMSLDQIVWKDRAHFLAMSARVMRQALIDEVRHFRAAKRSTPEIMTEWIDKGQHRSFPLDVFDDALERLFAFDPDRARVVELRFYAGLTMTEIAVAMNNSVSTTERRWRTARAWLIAALDGDD
ncbi:sigma-70 family RNA polymerase sigma factor [Sphingosinicellaceae bacterium]|nr:sigma-70 family RNA polymerase sigma factor [Sphingosinicellaceae bacterium]